MKKMLIAAAALALSVSAASAADAPGCFDQWSGLYAGVHAGYLFGDTDTVDGANGVGDVDLRGFLGGGLAGYNYQNCDWVVGIEADMGFGEADGADGVFDDIDLEPNGHIRARVGMVVDSDMLLFAAGGLAIGDMDATIPGVGNDSKTHFGLTVGAGIDYMVDPNWVIRAEYLLDYYGDEDYSLGGSDVSIDALTNTVRAAIIYHF